MVISISVKIKNNSIVRDMTLFFSNAVFRSHAPNIRNATVSITAIDHCCTVPMAKGVNIKSKAIPFSMNVSSPNPALAGLERYKAEFRFLETGLVSGTM